jgi:hypothetical protein
LIWRKPIMRPLAYPAFQRGAFRRARNALEHKEMAKKRANHTAAGQIKGGGQAEASTKVMQRVAVGAFSAAAGAAAFRP